MVDEYENQIKTVKDFKKKFIEPNLKPNMTVFMVTVRCSI